MTSTDARETSYKSLAEESMNRMWTVASYDAGDGQSNISTTEAVQLDSGDSWVNSAYSVGAFASATVILASLFN